MSKWPAAIGEVLLQRLTIDFILNRKPSLNKFTGLDVSEYRVLRKIFIDKNSAHVQDCEAFQIDIMILASMWMVRKRRIMYVKPQNSTLQLKGHAALLNTGYIS